MFSWGVVTSIGGVMTRLCATSWGQRWGSSNQGPARGSGVFTDRTCPEGDSQTLKGLVGRAEDEDGTSREAKRSKVTWPLVYATGGPCEAT